jgi:hypothetical protein
MKKLMIAAAAAAMIGGAYATDVCTDEGDVAGVDCLVYDLKISVKTLAPKYGACKGKKSGCSDGSCSEIYYLDNTSRTLKGYIWFCEDECWTIDDEPHIVLWDTKAKTFVVPIGYARVTKANGAQVTKYYYETDGLAFTFLGRYSKGMKKAAAAWEIDTDYLTGFAAGVNGSLMIDKDAGTAKLKSISGNFAGMATPSLTVSKKCEDDEDVPGYYAELCECLDSWCEASSEADDGVPATGTWSLKYNKKLSKGSTPMYKLVPKYALWNEDK